LSYKDYVRHIGYGLVRAGLPLTYTEGFEQRAVFQAPPALLLSVISFGEPFFVPLAEPVIPTEKDLEPFFCPDEAPVLVLPRKLGHYWSLFKTPKALLRLELEKQGLRKVLDEQKTKPWDVVKIGIETLDGQMFDLSTAGQL
jgi:hypothetical protein